MDPVEGRYNWDDDTDPSEAEFLANSSSLTYLPDGKTAIAYVGIYDEQCEPVGDVGVYVSNLPNGLDTVYRVQVEDKRIVGLESGTEVYEAWAQAREE